MHPAIDVVVQKFGSAALESVESMQKAAQIVANAQASGKTCLVVVTAMAHTTSELEALARRCGAERASRELDTLLACGESISAPLFALCLQNLGARAVSMSASEAGIRFGARAGRVTTDVDSAHVMAMLRERVVPVVAGSDRVLLVGRDPLLGNADLAAVALAAAIDAGGVELYTDDDAFADVIPLHEGSAAGRRMNYGALLSVLADGKHTFFSQAAAEYAEKRGVSLRIVPMERSARSTLVKNPTMVPPAFLDEPSAPSDTDVFAERESNIRGYCRSFPVVFARSKGALQWDEAGNRYVDFFSGAGALNYGHNPDAIKGKLLAYLEQDGVSHALDMHTVAKRAFLETFRDVILVPRNYDYKVQFCGPTGANAVEAALKLARLKTGRSNIGYFSGGWHGMTAGCLSVCGNRENREAAGVPLAFTTPLPYPVGPYSPRDALGQLTAMFEDPNGGFDLPAAVILETVQGEGGIFAAPTEWLRGLRALCDKHDVLMIVDDVQVGCGRAGTFFSFEQAGIVPDIVCLSKSIGGYGQPMALLLMRPEVDVWKPGQHTGTFRGNQLAFVAATAALEFWRDPAFVAGIETRSARIRDWLVRDIAPLSAQIEVRGRGMIWGVDFTRAGGPEIAGQIAAACFQNGLIIERCGRDDTVLKMMPPLNIALDQLEEGLAILARASEQLLSEAASRSRARGLTSTRPGRAS